VSWAGSAWPGRRHQCQDAATGGAATGTRRLRRRPDLGILPSQFDPSQATSCSPSWTAGTAGPWGISWLTAVVSSTRPRPRSCRSTASSAAPSAARPSSALRSSAWAARSCWRSPAGVRTVQGVGVQPQDAAGGDKQRGRIDAEPGQPVSQRHHLGGQEAEQQLAQLAPDPTAARILF
jgi:hypothetical protein